MSVPAVSVVIPTRNRADLLALAISSALNQTFRDLEVLVVDDASEDGTPQVVAGFSDSRLRFLPQRAQGGGAATRNAGIRSARGELIAFLDDDDEWMPEKIELQVARFRDGGPRVGVVYSSYVVVDRDSGRVLGRKVAQERGDLSRRILGRNVVGGTSSVVARRSSLEEAGLFDSRLPSFQDYDLWIRLSRLVDFDFVDRDLLRYYVHPKKIWTNLEALLRGIEIMNEKHGSSRPLRRNLAVQSLGIGAQYCARGEMTEGRTALWKSVHLNPVALRPYVNLAVSLLGKRVFGAVRGARLRLTRPVGFRSESSLPPVRGQAPRQVGR